MAIDVEMCMMVQELRVRERQLAEKARDIKVSPVCPCVFDGGVERCMIMKTDKCRRSQIRSIPPLEPYPTRPKNANPSSSTTSNPNALLSGPDSNNL